MINGNILTFIRDVSWVKETFLKLNSTKIFPKCSFKNSPFTRFPAFPHQLLQLLFCDTAGNALCLVRKFVRVTSAVREPITALLCVCVCLCVAPSGGESRANTFLVFDTETLKLQNKNSWPLWWKKKGQSDICLHSGSVNTRLFLLVNSLYAIGLVFSHFFSPP